MMTLPSPLRPQARKLMKALRTLFLCTVAGAVLLLRGPAGAQDPREYKSGIVWPEPALVTPGKDAGPPSDAIVLFDGKDLSKWNGGDKWIIQDGYAIAAKNGITTKDPYGDCQLHVEFATPEKVEGRGQGRGNSGVYLMEKYEVQILDSYENKTYFDGQCASIYKQHPPLVNASHKPGEWQTYDIIFEAPRFDADKKLTRPGYVTVLHNGIVVQNHFELQGGTFYDQPAKYTAHPPKAPLHLQFHGNPVRFRNIWIRELKEIEGKKPEKK
jgi:3-keto-disaccharide hydrolase